MLPPYTTTSNSNQLPLNDPPPYSSIMENSHINQASTTIENDSNNNNDSSINEPISKVTNNSPNDNDNSNPNTSDNSVTTKVVDVNKSSNDNENANTSNNIIQNSSNALNSDNKPPIDNTNLNDKNS